MALLDKLLRFIHFKTKASFDSSNDLVTDNTISFVQDVHLIHTHGTDYYCGESEVATQESLTTHTEDINNPHNVTKLQIGLGNVDNTSDVNKPVSTAQQSAIDAVDNKTAVYTTVPTLSANYTIPANATTREYIYEISIGATKYNVTAAEGIKWIDNNLPLIEANSKLIVSVVNNIAVWGTIYE